MRIARRIYRLVLALAPASLRARHANEMEDAFAAMLRDARRRGRAAAAWAVVRAYGDVVVVMFRHRFHGRLISGGQRERHVPMLRTELRHALRAFMRQRLSTGLALTMLALGIGANVVVFSLVNELYLRPFPFPEPERLVYLNERAPRWNLDRTGINYPDFVQWRGATQRFSGMALYDGVSLNLADGQGAERIIGGMITHDFFAVLGVQPLAGRTFREDEDVPRGPRVAILSERMWRDRFDGRIDALGETLRLNGVVFEIVGIMPRHAEFPDDALVWIPLAGDPNQKDQSYSYSGIGRLRPGVSVADAEQDLRRAHARIWEARDNEQIVSPLVVPLREEFVGGFHVIASALAASVVLLLVVACANVAAVMLARAMARRREMSIRLAVGANRWQLLQQLFIENLLLSGIGAAMGVALGRWALRLLVTAVSDGLPQWAAFAFDWRVALFSIALAVATTVLFGWAPALHAIRGDLRSAMQDAVAGAIMPSPRGRRTLTGLVGAQFALAAILLVAGALLVRAFGQVRSTDPGYRPDNVLLFTIALPPSIYADGPKRIAFWDGLRERLLRAPGVDAAGIISCPPLGCHWGNFYQIEGRPAPKPGEPNPVVLSRLAGAGYFEAMGLRLREGRFFDDRDGRENTPPVVIVNDTFARTFWPSEPSVLGKRLRFNGEPPTWITVVGVTEDIKHYGLERPMRPGLYFPAPMLAPRTSAMTVAVHTTTAPESFVQTARAELQKLDPTLPLFNVATATAMLSDSMRTRATYSWMLVVFAALTVVLALGGTYGVTSYLVTQRTREIGIRMAIGAQARDIVHAMLRGTALVVVVGIVIGLAASLLLAPWMGDLLFDVSPRDPAVLTIAGLVLAMAALAAMIVPARRAARSDPMLSLRT